MRILIGLLSVLLLSAACGGGEEPFEFEIPVTVTVPQPTVITSIAVVPCRLESGSEAVVTPLHPGRILEVYVSEGDSVEEGDLLVELSTDQQYRGAVAAGAARLSAARALASNAENDLQRAERLLENGAISDLEYDMALSAHRSARASLSGAYASYQNARSLSQSGRITAPFSGTVTRVWAREGFVSSGPLISITDSGVMEAELLLSQVHSEYLKEGLPVIFSTPHFPGELFSGEVVSHSNSVDPVSGLFSVRAQFSRGQDRLRSGMTGTATIGLETSENTLVLPMKDLIPSFTGEWRVAVVEDGMARIAQVETGLECGTDVEIISGISPGDSIIELGRHLVADGSPVRVVTP